MTLEGPLSKWTNMIHGWQFRWFVLDTNHATFSYYTSKENKEKGDCRGCIRLSEAHVGYDNEDDITFTITVDDKTFHLQARNLDEREKWVSRIEKAIRTHATLDESTRKLTEIEVKLSQSEILHFDSTLTELDSYLQLLIEQLKTLEKRKENEIEKMGENTTKGLDPLIESTRNLIETIKHAIVCLQIAKANCDPSNDLQAKNELKQVLNNLSTSYNQMSKEVRYSGEKTKEDFNMAKNLSSKEEVNSGGANNTLSLPPPPPLLRNNVVSICCKINLVVLFLIKSQANQVLNLDFCFCQYLLMVLIDT